MAPSTTKQSETSQTFDSAAFEAAASEAASQAKDFFETQIAFSEKASKAGFELMAENYKLSQELAVEGYRNMTANTAAYFDAMKALTKTKDAAAFAKVSQEQGAKAFEMANKQGQDITKSMTDAIAKSMEAGREALDKSFGK